MNKAACHVKRLALAVLACIRSDMEELNESTEKLKAALARLEGVLDGVFERAGDPDASRREVAALVSDRAELAEELDAALARETELQQLADEASEALGSAIAEVRAALGQSASG